MRQPPANRHQHRSRRAKRRSGAAFLILVVLVLLVVVAATKTFVVGEVSSQRSEANRLRARSMAAAIEVARGMHDDATSSLALPIDGTSNQRIEVRVNVKSASITAHWMSGDSIVEQMVRPLSNDGNHSR